VKNWQFLNIEDGKVKDNFEAFARLDITKYDTIICPHSGENHPDHSCIYDFLKKLEVKSRIYTYEVWSTLTNPSHYLDISNIIEKKQKLIEYYTSQLAQVDYIPKIL
jgi:hypothetical protein